MNNLTMFSLDFILNKSNNDSSMFSKENILNSETKFQNDKSLDFILNKWMFKRKDLHNSPSLNDLYFKLKNMDFSAIINAFTSRISKINCQFSKSEQVSGSICFFGGIFTSLLNFGTIKNIEHLFTFALCYMLIDHHLDNPDIDEEEKDKNMKEIYEFIYYNKRESSNKLINAVKDRYFKMIGETNCLDLLQKLFIAEIEGAKISKRKDLNRDDYVKAAKEKGGYTGAVIGKIIGLTHEQIEDAYNVGYLVQLVDDLLDFSDDEKMGIYTLAQYDLNKSQNLSLNDKSVKLDDLSIIGSANYLDKYIIDTLQEISKLNNVYDFFKPILISGLILGLRDLYNSPLPEEHSLSNQLSNYKRNRSQIISKELFIILEPYMIFDVSKDYLNNWFHEKLYEYIDELNI